MRDPVDQVEHEKLKAAESEAVKEATDEFFSDLGFS